MVYELQEGKALSLSLLAGYGSYEQLRGGLELEHRNVLGWAHSARLRGIQSFKASSGDFLYTVPELFFENVDLFVRGSGLRREEISFTREEYGGAVGVHKRIVPIQTDVAVRYDYEFLNALDVSATDTNRIGVTEARAAPTTAMHGRLTPPDRSKRAAWPYPVIANGRLYLRDQAVLHCYDVQAAKSGAP